MRAVRSCLLALAALAALAAPAYAQSTAMGRTAPAQAGFGGAIAIVDDEVLVGEPANQMRPGMVYVYARGADGWVERTRLTAEDAFASDGFGTSLAADGATLIIGASAQNHGAGAAYVFERGADGAWTQVARLTADDAGAEDGFGGAVALRGDDALVAAPGQGGAAGAVYAFRRTGKGQWAAAGKLAPETADEQALFGVALALDDGLAFVGAPGADARTGTVIVYARDAQTGEWRESGRLEPSAIERGDAFGASIAARGGRVAVGAPFMYGSGSVIAFQRSARGDAWSESDHLVPFDAGRADSFGSAIALDDAQLWVGAPRAAAGRGAVYGFDFDGDALTAHTVRKLTPFADTPRALLGAALAVRGDLLAAGAVGVDNGAGATVVLERDPVTGDWPHADRLVSPPERFASIVGGAVRCENGHAAQFECSGVDLLSFLSVQDLGGGRGIEVNDIWGWTDAATGREYALVGRTDGTAFVDVTDPVNPRYLGELPKTEASPVSVWRDVKVYRDHAYIVADGAGPHGMQIFDLTRLRDVAGEPVTFDADVVYDRINSAHNIVINEETGFAYAVGASAGGETCGGGLHMIDIRDPKNPTFVGCFADPQTGRAATGYTHDAQCVVYRGPDARYAGREICLGSNETALSIADVTDKQNPVALSRASYPNVAYSHQGWLSEDQRFFFMNDELDEINGLVSRTRTLVWDVADLEDPQLVREFLGETEASDHNLYIRGHLMYQSHYQAGLRIVDVSDPLNPVEIAYFDTVPYGTNTPGFGGSWSNYPYFESDIIIVTSGSEGLFVVKLQAPDVTS